MPNYLENLRQYKEYGESITNGLTLFHENLSLPDQVPPNLSKCLQDLEEFAKKTIERATSPVQIAIMGEISSGKTLLVGSLIGYADALPVNEIATTGNVTAIHLVQQEDEGTTKVDQFQVKYLSEQGVKECLDFMLKEAEQRAKAAILSSTQLEDLQKLRPTNSVDWNGILQWCEQAWSNTNLELRYLIRELVLFARSYNAYGKDICGETYKIDRTTAKKGLKLAEPQNISEINFSSLPPVPRQWQDITQPSALELQNSFSLIERIDITVNVSKQIWDLSSLKGSNEFVLLDLPGLGSENSGVRDTFLSMLQIKEVQTFLLLLNGRAAAPGQVAAKIRTTIQQHKGEDIKDRIIVGVGRFNQLPLNAANKKALDDLIGDENFFEPSSEEVLSKLDILKQTIIIAENLTTKKDRILLLSQTFGLAKIAQESRLVEVCSPEFKPELDQVNKSDSEEFKLRQKWKNLGEILLNSESRSTLGRQLSDFADDGGIGRLRSLLQEHVAEYGLKQLHKDTHSVAQGLRQQQNNLKSILEKIRDNPIPESSPAYNKLRQAIDILRNTYQELKEDLGKQPLLQYNGVAVSDVVKDELSFKIHRWREWSTLFNSIQNGIINNTFTTKTAADDIFRRRRNDNNSFPTKSDDFYSTFEETFKQLKDFARERTQDALKELLSELSNKVEPQRHDLSEILRPQMEQQIQQNFGDDRADLFYNILQSDKPDSWLDTIIAKIPTEESSQTINSQTFFPLANKDQEHKFGQIFDWSVQKQSSASPRPFNHEFLVLRLRSEMVASASLNLADYISQLTEVVNFELSVILTVVINELQVLLKDELLLRMIAAGDEQTNNPPWLETISQIPLISCPLL